MTDEELLPCPFCGSAADFTTRPNQQTKWGVMCDGCTAYVVADAHGAAIRKWNTRPREEQLAAENTQLASGACIYPNGEGLLGDEHGNSFCSVERERVRLDQRETDLMAELNAIPPAPNHVITAAPPELAERAFMIELATQMALAAGYAPHCWPTWEREATVIIPTIAAFTTDRERDIEAALIDAAATLAAAISLLEKGGKAAKKAAPSNTMFDMMLNDYRKSLASLRRTLSGGTAK